MAVSIKVEIPNPSGVANRILSGRVKKYANTRLHAYCSPYVPMESGTLDGNVKITEDYVHYKVPYAHYQWDGNGFNFSRDKHPLATSHWEKAMSVAKGAQLARDIEGYIKRG